MNNLEELKAICDAATPGPWYAITINGTVWVAYDDVIESKKEGQQIQPTLCDMNSMIPVKQQEANARFASAARTEMPKLIERVRELENQVGLHSGELIGQEHRLGTMYEYRIQKLEAALRFARLDFVNPNSKLAEEIDALLSDGTKEDKCSE